MDNEIKAHKLLGSLYTNAPEDKDHVKKYLTLAANGAFPYVIREMMKHYAYQILGSDSTSEQEKHEAKLLICYSWWARALEGGIPKKNFEQYMYEHLEHLDHKHTDDGVMEKWKKYGG